MDPLWKANRVMYLSGEAAEDKAKNANDLAAEAPPSPHTMRIRAHGLTSRMLLKRGPTAGHNEILA